ncbi:hypothetical protein [Acinetobacter sp.]|uniref:hypothetical protein n=1 Tax=Acinetobacter sp. TaxID=472 RepID=UPI003D015A2E
MSDAPLEEKKARAAAFLKKYRTSVGKKGSTVVADFADKLPEQYQSFPRLHLGIPSLDTFFGGGLPLGGLITVAGDTSVGKTTFALRVVAAAQKQGKLIAYCDAEGTLDLEWARKQGVDTSSLVVLTSGMSSEENFTPTTLEDYLNGVSEAVNAGIFDLAILDSLDAMIARGRVQSGKSGAKRDLDDKDIALKARVMSDFYPRILGAMRGNSTTLLQIGQLRASGIGGPFVSLQMSGGNARKYYDLLTLSIRRGARSEAPTDGLIELGYAFIMKTAKSKISGIREGSDMKTAFFFDQGFDPTYELTVQALDRGVIKKKGNAAAEYTTSTGEVHNIRAGKDYKIAAYIKENNLDDDLLLQVTGELTPVMEAVLDTDTAEEDAA